MTDAEARAHVARTDSLLARLDGASGPGHELALECVQAVVQLYGEALARLVTTAATELRATLADDELVSHLLLVHGLHPIAVETRVARALDEVRPYLRSHGGDVALIDIRDGVAHVRLDGTCHGCPSSSATMRSAIEDAIRRLAPDLDGVEAEGLGDAAPVDRPAGDAWTVAGALAELATDAPILRTVAGTSVVFVRMNGTAWAYRPGCPACGESIARGALADATLGCPGCGRRYDVRQAGRCLDDPLLHLDPIPLLVGDAGAMKVAVGAP